MKNHTHVLCLRSANARRGTFSEQEDSFQNLLLRVAVANSAFGQLKKSRQTSATSLGSAVCYPALNCSVVEVSKRRFV